jgi:hypothetical protein
MIMDMNLSSIAPVISASIIDKKDEEKKRKFKTYAKKVSAEAKSMIAPAFIYEAGHGSDSVFPGTYEKPKFKS